MTTQPKLPDSLGAVNWYGPDNMRTKDAGLIHYVRIPEGATRAKPAPAVLLVHGRAGDESVMWVFAQAIPADVAILSVRAPYEDAEEGGYAWFGTERKDGRLFPVQDEVKASVAKLGKFIRAASQIYPINGDRMVAFGFSQGAAMISTLSFFEPDLLHGIAPLAGFMPLPSSHLPDADLDGYPVFMAHGTKDDVIPMKSAQRNKQILESADADVTWHTYNVGHKLPIQGIRDLGTWLKNLL